MRKTTAKYDKQEWIGKKFGRLTVKEIIRVQDSAGRWGWRWICDCDCGNTITATPSRLVCGGQESCSQCKSNLHKCIKHGESHTKLFYTWCRMRNRCNNPKDKRYAQYGGRGIKVCDEWNNDYEPFAKWSRENGYSEELSIDRIDNDGNYCPDNCRWADDKTQQRNKSTNHYVEIDGEKKALSEWCEIYGADYSIVHSRITYRHWEPKRALETPSGGKGANGQTYDPSTRAKPVERKYHIERRYVDVDGEHLSLKAACRKLGLPYKAVHLRITRYGMTVEEAISRPFEHKEERQ